MKKISSLLFAVSVLLVAVSCTQDAFDSSVNAGDLKTRGNVVEIDWSALDTTYFVAQKDVDAYIHFKKLIAKSEKQEFEVKEVVPMGLNDEATLAYLLNYNDGWEIVSADKRAPVVLASRDEGQFDLKEAPANVMTWIEALEADVLYLRISPSRPGWADNDICSKMQNSIDFWLAINADENYIISHDPVMLHPDSIALDPPTPGPTLMQGHWELMDILYRQSIITYQDHIIPTHWYQTFPLNENCPDSRIYSGLKVPAGCLAVSGGQLLLYLHNTIGLPIFAPVNAHYTGFYDNYTYSIAGMNTNQWNNFNSAYENDRTASIASMLAYVGHEVHMQYYETTSTSHTQYFIDDLLAPNGIECDFDNYSSSQTIQCVLNGDPVLVEAFRSHNETGHSFLIDYYRKYRDCTLYCYEFIYDGPSYEPRPLQQYVHTVYSDVINENIRMNWGDGMGLDDSNFALSGNWDYHGYALNSSLANIAYNFRAAE